MNSIIFDASTIINFSMNGLLPLLSELKNSFSGKFLITKQVEHEIVKRPLKIKKYMLGALRIQELLKNKTLESSSVKEEDMRKFLDLANRTFIARGKYLHLIDKGEASCLALSEELSRKGIKNVLAVDERTTRMLCENPENLRKLMENKLHTKVQMKKENLQFQKFKIIRSVELAYLAYKKGLVKIGNGNLLEALLYAMKYKGCSVSREEVEAMKRL